ncbi:hypothetical protein [Hyphomonas sp.]|uniref:hypothetical protein n=1 Tax=Hyphomonas sp. TaxID=87 RepID=UPI0032424060
MLTEPDFYIAAIALLSLVLSQLPPIQSLLSKERIEIYTQPKIALLHVAGNPNTFINLSVWNRGAKPIRIKSISMTIETESGKEIGLPLSTFHHTATDDGETFYRPISIQPDAEWTKFCNFARNFPPDLEKRYRELIDDLELEKLSHQFGNDSQNLFYASEELTQRAIQFFDELFDWSVGSHSVKIRIETDKKDHFFSADFAIFESQFQRLSEFENYFRYGRGIGDDLALEHNLVWCPMKNTRLSTGRSK